MTEPNWRNRTLFHGDNPPFNKGRGFHAPPIAWRPALDSRTAGHGPMTSRGEWRAQIQDDWPAVWQVIDATRVAWGDDMAAFLCFMGVRLIEMRRVLRDNGGSDFSGPVEVDETYMGGMKDRESNQVRAEVVKRTDSETLKGFVTDNASDEAQVYTDDASAYKGLPNQHETVKHSVSEYVRGEAHTNGVESFWSMLKRGHNGTYHKMSPKHLDRYVNEFAGRHNLREADTLSQMGLIVKGLEGKRLTYADLKQDNGRPSGARV